MEVGDIQAVKHETIAEYRREANKHPGHRSAKMILELCSEVERLRKDLITAYDAAFAPYPMKGKALAALKRKAGVD